MIFKSKIESYKNRVIDKKSPVHIYRNLVRGGVWYSIKQNGLVVGHTQTLALKGIEFKISKSGQKRARIEQQRNVHAFVVGFLIDDLDFCLGEAKRITYNPFKTDGFVYSDGGEIKNEYYAVFNQKGVYIM